MLGRKPQSIWVRGEHAAAKYLRRNGYTIITRNLRLPMGEIDILCLEKSTGTIVIVEVKARAFDANSPRQIDPIASITQKKQAKLRSLAHAIKKMPQYASEPIRIDAVSVLFESGRRKPEITLYRGCVGDS